MELTEKILLVQLYSNGDCLYTTTIAKQIKQDHPACHLTWMIADYCKDIIAGNPYVDDVIIIKENNITSWRQYPDYLTDQIRQWREDGTFTKIYLPQIIGDNIAVYDQNLRASLFRGYDKPVTVDVTPVIHLSDAEKQEVDEFAVAHQLASYRQVFLFEYAPKSGQANLSFDKALSVGQTLAASKDIAVIFASGGVLPVNQQFISAEKLNLRQVAYLSNYCHFLLGCSSGVTWATTSDAAKQLYMLQVLGPGAYWLNSVVNDHKRFGLPTGHIIETADDSEAAILACLQCYLQEGFAKSHERFHTPMKLKFRMTRGIIGKAIIKGNFKMAVKHIAINLRQHGLHPYLLKAILLGFITAPFYLSRKENMPAR